MKQNSSLTHILYSVLKISEPVAQPLPQQRTRALGLSYLIDENPPWYICLLLGLQVRLVNINFNSFSSSSCIPLSSSSSFCYICKLFLPVLVTDLFNEIRYVLEKIRQFLFQALSDRDDYGEVDTLIQILKL